MRRIILLFAAVLLGSIGWSQTLNIHYKNGQSVQFDAENIDYIEFTEKAENNTSVTAGDAIDLGLSVKWASCNVGATSPEKFGDKFAWGETETKANFSKNNYLYYDSYSESYVDIGMDIKGTDYDVAHVKWGDNWRMPTLNELKELKSKCTWEWSKVNGINGFIVTGLNGNTIFFPCGNFDIFLWASTISNNQLGGKNEWVNAIGFNGTIKHSGNISWVRYKGCFVRPVMPY